MAGKSTKFPAIYRFFGGDFFTAKKNFISRGCSPRCLITRELFVLMPEATCPRFLLISEATVDEGRRGCRGCRGCRLEIIGRLTGKHTDTTWHNYWKTQVSPSKDGLSHNLHSHRRGGSVVLSHRDVLWDVRLEARLRKHVAFRCI